MDNGARLYYKFIYEPKGSGDLKSLGNLFVCFLNVSASTVHFSLTKYSKSIYMYYIRNKHSSRSECWTYYADCICQKD